MHMSVFSHVISHIVHVYYFAVCGLVENGVYMPWNIHAGRGVSLAALIQFFNYATTVT